MTRIAPDWLSAAPTQAVMSALAPARPLFVGGCVRDALMGRISEDIDIAVTSPPAETTRLAENAGLKAVATGVDHGVVTVIAEGRPFEIATLRRDVATDGRRAVVAFTDRIEDDAARRDFTMNALYADAEGEVFDPLGDGVADLRARRIRFIGDARARIREDYLRILRFFRFHAQFGITQINAEGCAACLAERRGLDVISAERIGAEMKKLLAATDPGPALVAMGGILDDILPGARWPDDLITAEAEWRLAPDPMRRLVAMKAAMLDRLRLSKTEIAAVNAISASVGQAPEKAAYRYGADSAISALAIEGAAPDGWRDRLARAAEAAFPVTAQDLMDRGMTPGPELGAALKRLEDQWIDNGFSFTREVLLEDV